MRKVLVYRNIIINNTAEITKLISVRLNLPKKTFKLLLLLTIYCNMLYSTRLLLIHKLLPALCIVVLVIAGNHAVLSSAGSGIIKIISKSKFGNR